MVADAASGPEAVARVQACDPDVGVNDRAAAVARGCELGILG